MAYIARYISDEGVRLSIAVTTDVVETAKERHNLYPIAAAALGRTMTGAALLAVDYKNKESVSIKIKGDGPLGGVYADAYNGGLLRGYVEAPQVLLPLKNGKLDVGGAVGEGEITVTRFSHMKTPYTSQAKLVSGEIAEDIAYYLYMSEQTASTLSLGVLVSPEFHILGAGGFYVQALPGAQEEALAKVEENIASIGPITTYLSEHPQGELLAEKILDGLTYKKLTTMPLQFACTCSKEKIEKTLLSLNDTDRKDLLTEKEIELVCHYCNEKYVLSHDELETLFTK